jgi:hypothetical protein
MQKGDSRQVALILKRYKFKNGEVNFPAIFTVPSTERLPALVEKDFLNATALVVGALTMAFEKMNFKRKMDGVLVNNIADEIIDTCDEDNLSLEDLVLFLQNLVRGKYGNLEEVSVSRFMNMFTKYRDERHLAIVEFRENEHLELKALGDANRSCVSDPLAEHFSRLGETISSLKETLKEVKKENHVLKQIDKL